MTNYVAAIGLAALATSTVVALPSSVATAATRPCTTGTWRLLAETGTDHGRNGQGVAWRQTFHGAAGVHLVLGGSGAVYNYTGSAHENNSGTDFFGHPTTYWVRHQK